MSMDWTIDSALMPRSSDHDDSDLDVSALPMVQSLNFKPYLLVLSTLSITFTADIYF